MSELRVDGGACVNNLLMQFQADLLGIPVQRPQVIETSDLGTAYLAGLATGVRRSTEELSAQWKVEPSFHPTMPRDRAAELMVRWERAVRQAVGRREGRSHQASEAKDGCTVSTMKLC